MIEQGEHIARQRLAKGAGGDRLDKGADPRFAAKGRSVTFQAARAGRDSHLWKATPLNGGDCGHRH